MRKTLLVAISLTGFLAGMGSAAGPDADTIARVTGLQPQVENGVAKVSVPRSDLTVTVDGVRMHPFQGLTSWAAFTTHEQPRIMFLHFWGKGPVEALARGIKAARATQRPS